MPPPSRLSTSVAISIIETAWISYRDRQLFQILKVAVRTLETFFGADILRRTAPKDYELLRDSCIPFTLRFRFAGSEFPPVIVFKIYTDSVAVPAKYVSPSLMNGKQQVVDQTKFYSDLVKVRGPQSVTAQLLKDEVFHSQYGIVAPDECVTTKDCLKLKSLRDELPAYMGGKGNTWRKLTLSDVPRLTVLHDVLGFALGTKIVTKITRKRTKEQRRLIPDSRRIRAILPYLIANNDIHLHFQVLTAICRDANAVPVQSAAHNALVKSAGSTVDSVERRRAAKARAKKLLHLYTGKSPVPKPNTQPDLVSNEENVQVSFPEREGTSITLALFDEEAEELFEWSKNLPPVDDL